MLNLTQEKRKRRQLFTHQVDIEDLEPKPDDPEEDPQLNHLKQLINKVSNNIGLHTTQRQLGASIFIMLIILGIVTYYILKCYMIWRHRRPCVPNWQGPMIELHHI